MNECLDFCLFAVKLLHGIVWRCYLFGRICECNVIGKVEFCVKNSCMFVFVSDLHVVLSEWRAESLKKTSTL